MKPISTTRWAYHSEVFSAIQTKHSFNCNWWNYWLCFFINKSDVRIKSSGKLFHMKSVEFMFAFELLDPILWLILKTYTIIYCKFDDCNATCWSHLATKVCIHLIMLTLPYDRSCKCNFSEYLSVFNKLRKMSNVT